MYSYYDVFNQITMVTQLKQYLYAEITSKLYVDSKTRLISEEWEHNINIQEKL